MATSRASRSSIILICALAVSAATQMIGPVMASDPGNELDALAYGSPSESAKPARAAGKKSATTALPTPSVIETSKARAQLPADFENSPGLLALIGLDNRQLAPSPTRSASPLDANAGFVGPTMSPSAATSAEFENSPGLLAVVGLDSRQLAPSPRAVAPRESYARVAAPLPPVVVMPAPIVVASQPILAVSHGPEYRLGAGDKLRVMVFGQEGLTNTYAIDAGGAITMPLIGRVSARGRTPGSLAEDITARLRKGFIREPSVAVEIESYRPFFILGEVAAPGQYPYVPNMSVEAAVAIAGGFSPRARRDSVTVTHPAEGGLLRAEVPLGTPLTPGDTVLVSERWF